MPNGANSSLHVVETGVTMTLQSYSSMTNIGESLFVEKTGQNYRGKLCVRTYIAVLPYFSSKA